MNRAENYGSTGATQINSRFPMSGKTQSVRTLGNSVSGRTKNFYRLSPRKAVAHQEVAPRRALIVGDSYASCRLAHELKRHFPEHYKIVGIVTPTPGQVSPNGVPVVGSLSDIAGLARQHEVDEVIVADYFDPAFKTTEDQIIAQTRHNADAVSNAMTLANASSYKTVKRILDIMFSLTALVAFAPLLAVLAVINKITSPGPVLFSQERVGLNGKRFQIYKLRTMHLDAEVQTGPVLAQHRDKRCTPLGAIMRATKIDELPQFYNVLRGDMSIVGPRPERPVFTDIYERHVPNYAQRHAVLPGLTGIAQTSGDQLTHVNVKLHYDLAYVHNCSLWLDIVLFARTPVTILSALWRKPAPPLSWEINPTAAAVKTEQSYSEATA
jgi:lipopolysaccharide/colanic/teichoic acid biosynthesis glycosyltransferase